MRKRETWEKAYCDYTYPNLPIIKAINEAIAQKAIPVIYECTETSAVEAVEVVEVVEVVKSFSTLEPKPELVYRTKKTVENCNSFYLDIGLTNTGCYAIFPQLWQF